jgi:hypothetical protein
VVEISELVGSELHKLLELLGAKPNGSCGCAAKIAEMNKGGVAWCREHRAEIVEHLFKAYKGLTWADVAKAAAAAVTSGRYLQINPLDVCGSLVDLAIERAEVSSRRAPRS